jgi:hypothetical protein
VVLVLRFGAACGSYRLRRFCPVDGLGVVGLGTQKDLTAVVWPRSWSGSGVSAVVWPVGQASPRAYLPGSRENPVGVLTFVLSLETCFDGPTRFFREDPIGVLTFDIILGTCFDGPVWFFRMDPTGGSRFRHSTMGLGTQKDLSEVPVHTSRWRWEGIEWVDGAARA